MQLPALTDTDRTRLDAAVADLFPGISSPLDAIEAHLALNIGSRYAGGGLPNDMLRARWRELFNASRPEGHPTLSEHFWILPIAERTRGFLHPPTGTLLRPWVLTDQELATLFSAATLEGLLEWEEPPDFDD